MNFFLKFKNIFLVALLSFFAYNLQAELGVVLVQPSLLQSEQEVELPEKQLTSLQKLKRYLIAHKKAVGAVTAVTVAFLGWKYLLKNNDTKTEPISQPIVVQNLPANKPNNRPAKGKITPDKPVAVPESEISDSGSSQPIAPEPVPGPVVIPDPVVIPVINKPVKKRWPAECVEKQLPQTRHQPVIVRTDYGRIVIRPLAIDQIEYADVLKQLDGVSCGEHVVFNAYCELTGDTDRLCGRERNNFKKAERLCLSAADDDYFSIADEHFRLTRGIPFRDNAAFKEAYKARQRNKAVNCDLMYNFEQKLEILKKAQDQFVFFPDASATLLHQFYRDLVTQEKNFKFYNNIENFHNHVAQYLGVHIHGNHYIMIKLELIQDQATGKDKPKVTVYDSMGYGGLENDPDILKIVHIFTHGTDYQIGE